ncbi:hypothetical protein F5884DRAFT_683208 [Xylogone sp. PMI_703]|nr:hypothetical protein F5884DRAFT_683208 [Xylogone sp. PMI_703]
MFSWSQNNKNNKPFAGSEEDDAPAPPEPECRTDFRSDAGTLVQGWPSKGGIYVLSNCYAVELEFLGLDRFQPTPRSEDQAEEDAHCDQMRRLGAKWWSSRDDYIRHAMEIPSRDSLMLFVGWPSDGGVWVLKTTRRDALLVKGIGRIHNALNMTERCRVIEESGGTFYQNPKDCADLDLA